MEHEIFEISTCVIFPVTRHSPRSGTKNSLTVVKEKLETLLKVNLFVHMNCAT